MEVVTVQQQVLGKDSENLGEQSWQLPQTTFQQSFHTQARQDLPCENLFVEQLVVRQVQLFAKVV